MSSPFFLIHVLRCWILMESYINTRYSSTMQRYRGEGECKYLEKIYTFYSQKRAKKEHVISPRQAFSLFGMTTTKNK